MNLCASHSGTPPRAAPSPHPRPFPPLRARVAAQVLSVDHTYSCSIGVHREPHSIWLIVTYSISLSFDTRRDGCKPDRAFGTHKGCRCISAVILADKHQGS